MDDPPSHWILQAVHKLRKRGGKMKGELDTRTMGDMAPNAGNTITNEKALPPWVQEARQLERTRKAEQPNG